MPSILPRCLTYWLDRRQMSFQIVLLVEPLWIWDLSSLRCRSSLERLRTNHQAQQLENSIDLNGDCILFLPLIFKFISRLGKHHSNLPCEIYTADGTLTLTRMSMLGTAIFTDHQGNQVQPSSNKPHDD